MRLGVTRGDTHLRSGRPFVSRVQSGLRQPKRRILGHELAGEVEAVGAAVTEFEVGDRVFGALPSLALSTGAHAECMCVPESFPLTHIPAGLSFEEAGGVGDGALLALNCMRPAGRLEGKRILVYGASGSIGTAGVQMAKPFGANVTGVCNMKNVELVRSLGADVVIDYLQEDFTQNGHDVRRHLRRRRQALVPALQGLARAGLRLLPTDGFNLFIWRLHKRIGDKKVVLDLPPRMRKQDILFLKELIEAGEYRGGHRPDLSARGRNRGAPVRGYAAEGRHTSS